MGLKAVGCLLFKLSFCSKAMLSVSGMVFRLTPRIDLNLIYPKQHRCIATISRTFRQTVTRKLTDLSRLMSEGG